MKFSIITPNYNGGRFLEKAIGSVIEQSKDVELEHIIVDGGSTDGSINIITRHIDAFEQCIIEKDNGPAQAINKGLRLATGDIISWLNADDWYFPGALARVRQAFQADPSASMCFGGCIISDENDKEIRSAISRFKEFFHPFSSRFTYQCINYISQPALFFRHAAVDRAGLLREDMQAAWDYEFVLRLWRVGHAAWIKGAPLAAFRWHTGSISGQSYQIQFREEYEAAKADAGIVSVQTGLHFLVRWVIVAAYSAMATRRLSSKKKM